MGYKSVCYAMLSPWYQSYEYTNCDFIFLCFQMSSLHTEKNHVTHGRFQNILLESIA